MTDRGRLGPSAATRLLSACALSATVLGPVVPAATAQVVAPPPKVLSTVPDPPAGAVAEPVQMSGMPLQVGDLPPGIVVVRVIRRSFAENVPNQRVELRAVPSGRSVSAVTDASGRAQFSGQSLGTTVAASAVVDGEPLDSQAFEIPAQGGVRMVLVAGVGAGMPTGVGAAIPSGPESVTSAATDAPTSPQPAAAPVAADVITISLRRSTLTVVAALGVVGGGVLVFMGWRRRGTAVAAIEASTARVAARPAGVATVAGAVRDPGDSGSVSDASLTGGATGKRRAQAFQELVGLEQDFAASRVTEEEYGARREALLDELVALDATAAAPGRR